MNLFVIQGVSPTLTIGKVSRGILPFIAADAVRVFLILFLPALVLWLPNWLGLG